MDIDNYFFLCIHGIYLVLALLPKQYMNRAIRLEKHCKKLGKYLT